MPVGRIMIAGRELLFHKAISQPDFRTRNVLTNSPWTFVDLWLKRNGHREALLYWEHAKHFYFAANTLPMQSAPLLLYYAFMNAAKALLSAKQIPFDQHHGVKAHNMRYQRSKISLSNEGIRILSRGVLASLSSYFKEPETRAQHSLQDLFYNLVFIHRTYCLIYTSQSEAFFPLKDCEYVRDDETGLVFFRAQFARDVNCKQVFKKLPRTISNDGTGTIRSVDSIHWAANDSPTSQELAALGHLHERLRSDIHYINGSQTLWYLRGTGLRCLMRCSPTLTLAAMHRLSEICRYRPVELVAYMQGQKNWLLNEFVEMSPTQFFDEIAAEITGCQFLVPNVRAPT
jgi:hypothetical protein